MTLNRIYDPSRSVSALQSHAEGTTRALAGFERRLVALERHLPVVRAQLATQGGAVSIVDGSFGVTKVALENSNLNLRVTWLALQPSTRYHVFVSSSRADRFVAEAISDRTRGSTSVVLYSGSGTQLSWALTTMDVNLLVFPEIL